MSETNMIRVYLVPDVVGGKKVVRVCPRRGAEPAPEGGELLAELPGELAYRTLQRQLRKMAAKEGLLY